MEIHEIRYFIAVCETLNFTRAAERCHVSQPALTRAVQNLEEKLGGPLVNRERGNTHLTELGRMMRPYFEQVLGQMAEAQRQAKTIVRLDQTSLTVGLMCTIGPHRLVDLFSGFIGNYEGVEVYLKDAPASALEELLAKGELDVAIFCRPDDLDDPFHTLPLYREQLWLPSVPVTHSSDSMPSASRIFTGKDTLLERTASTTNTCAMRVKGSGAFS